MVQTQTAVKTPETVGEGMPNSGNPWREVMPSPEVAQHEAQQQQIAASPEAFVHQALVAQVQETLATKRAAAIERQRLGRAVPSVKPSRARSTITPNTYK